MSLPEVMIAKLMILHILIGILAIPDASAFATTSNCTFDPESPDFMIICDGITHIGPIIDDFVKVRHFCYSNCN